ncbi:MAG: hypothetical protein IPM79_38840 [Polyangiaceae bacterium]|nr:hypothetical protein [Polyangiaceae bacterium]
MVPRRGRCVLFVLGAGCVPEGPATDRGITLPEQTLLVSAAGDVLDEIFEDDFEREELGPDYTALSDAWLLEGGWLCAQNAKNQGVWLDRRLPRNVRVEFDAMSLSEDGDIKVELFGDGSSGASGVSYDDATGYVAIFGGWKNSLHVLARLDEHGDSRRARAVEPDSDDPATQAVVSGQVYRFKFERKHGNMLVMSVNGSKVLEYADPEPLAGLGHEHFGFNDWTAAVCFDNLVIEPL